MPYRIVAVALLAAAALALEAAFMVFLVARPLAVALGHLDRPEARLAGAAEPAAVAPGSPRLADVAERAPTERAGGDVRAAGWGRDAPLAGAPRAGRRRLAPPGR